jgi:hypothetical protein
MNYSNLSVAVVVLDRAHRPSKNYFRGFTDNIGSNFEFFSQYTAGFVMSPTFSNTPICLAIAAKEIA